MPPSRGLSSFVVVFVLFGIASCSGSRSPSHPVWGARVVTPTDAAQAPAPAVQPSPARAAATPAVPAAVRAQIDRGVLLFAQHCASCHGAAGGGTNQAPALVGEGTLPLNPPPGARVRRGKFESAMDLGMFIKDNMPLNGTHLPPRDVACVLAWLLKEHGRTPTEPISPSTAGAIRR